MAHISVLADEVVGGLEVRSGSRVIDATANGGGHAEMLLASCGKKGKLLAIEWDKTLYAGLQEKFKRQHNVILENDTFVHIKRIVERNQFGAPDAILFDLGFSSYHVDASGRGFSFQADEPLDMRYNLDTPESAADVLRTYAEEDLARIFKEYGEERFARRIARAIVDERRHRSLERTGELVDLIRAHVPAWYRRGRLHPATRVFQAVRIEVNKELESVREGIEAALAVLAPGGRIAVIAFHSLEDRIVKNMFRDAKQGGGYLLITKKPITPARSEVTANPRARSAKLRIIQKL